MSQITVSGNLAADPKIEFTRGGKAVAKFRVVENRGQRTDEGWQDGIPNGFNVQAWEGLAENIAESLTKGDRVVVVGRIVTERWTDKDSQEPRTAQFIKATEVGSSLRFHTVQTTKNTRGAQTGANPADEH